MFYMCFYNGNFRVTAVGLSLSFLGGSVSDYQDTCQMAPQTSACSEISFNHKSYNFLLLIHLNTMKFNVETLQMT